MTARSYSCTTCQWHYKIHFPTSDGFDTSFQTIWQIHLYSNLSCARAIKISKSWWLQKKRYFIWFQFLWIAFHVDQVFLSMFYLQKKWYWLSGKVLNENKLNFLGLLRIIEDAHITLRQTHREKGRVTITMMTEREVRRPPQTQEPKSSWSKPKKIINIVIQAVQCSLDTNLRLGYLMVSDDVLVLVVGVGSNEGADLSDSQQFFHPLTQDFPNEQSMQ